MLLPSRGDVECRSRRRRTGSRRATHTGENAAPLALPRVRFTSGQTVNRRQVRVPARVQRSPTGEHGPPWTRARCDTCVRERLPCQRPRVHGRARAPVTPSKPQMLVTTTIHAYTGAWVHARGLGVHAWARPGECPGARGCARMSANASRRAPVPGVVTGLEHPHQEHAAAPCRAARTAPAA